MNVYAPDYYKKFKCIADKCKHNCCIGWEIDIDSHTLSYYKTLKDNFGRRLNSSINDNCSQPYFVLTEDDRCPMLNSRNLCDVISNIGEKHLCQICADHPRFRNFFESRTEIGLGMCCEVASELILFKPTVAELVLIESSNEGIDESVDIDFLDKRAECFKIVQDRSMRLEDRVERLLKEFSVVLPKRSMFSWSRALLSLELLNDDWSILVREYLNDIKHHHNVAQEQFEIPFEQLLVYLLYRHTADNPDAIEAGIAFSVWGYRIIRTICENLQYKFGPVTPDVLVEICRLFSAEIEYSKNNLDDVYGFLNF